MKRQMQLTIGALLLLVGPTPHFAETYEPQPIEAMIEKSDLVVIGKVEKTFLYENEKGDVRRETVIIIKEVIAGEGKGIGETIVLEHFEGTPASKGGDVEHYSEFRPIFTPDEQALLLLLKKGEMYEVTGSFRGKIDIIGDKIVGIDTKLTDFKEAIKRIDRKEVSQLEVAMVPIEYQLAKVRAASGKRAAKAVSRYGEHLDGQFFALTRYLQYPPPLTITFHINPTGARDGNGRPIPFSDLRTAMNACVAEWNRIEDGHIRFQVASTSTNRAYNGSDSWSTVTFEDNFLDKKGATAARPRVRNGVVTSDIRFNTDYKWTTSATYPSSWRVDQPKDFRDVMTHELGHSVGLRHSNDKHKNNTMYYDSKRAETKRRTLEWGIRPAASI